MRPSVLILSDEQEFARAVLGRWQRERNVPAFTVMSIGAWKPSAERRSSGIALVSGKLEACSEVLANLEQTAFPAIFAAVDAKDVSVARQKFQRTAVLKKADDWLDTLVLLASEMLRRTVLTEHAADAEARARASERNAVLGKYMLEMRHTLNNALTSVLGNAELLLLEPGSLTGDAREQVDTIHNMSLRMHEVLQRFSSLESEMKFAEKDTHGDTLAAWKTAASAR
jgi:signal transduction histidine kinase